MAAASFQQGFAASALPQHSEDSPLPFYASSADNEGIGVFCTGPNQWEARVVIRGHRTTFLGFPSIATATEAFRRMQNGMSPSPVAGAPEPSRAPMPAPEQEAEPVPEPADASPAGAPVLELEPVHAAHPAPKKRYKGVWPRPDGFHAVFFPPGKPPRRVCCGTFPTAELAADAYDAAVREAGGKMVNTPRHPDEVQAVSWRGMPKEAKAAAPAPVSDVPAAQPNKRKRGRPCKLARKDGAAVPVSPVAAVTPSSQLASAAAARFRGVTAISGGGGFTAWLSFCNADGGLIRKMLGAFGTAEEAARAVDVAARYHSQLEQLNFPTPEELARTGRQTRSTHRQAGRRVERKVPEAEVSEEEEEEEVEPAPRGMSRRRMQSPVQVRCDADASDALAPAVSPMPEVPEAPPLPQSPPPQSPPVTPDPLALLMLEAPAPAPEEPPPPPPHQPNDDVVAFLRSIAPPLRSLDAAVAAAPGSGVSMRQLRQLLLLRQSTLVAAYFDSVAASLHINGDGDRLDLIAALDQLGP